MSGATDFSTRPRRTLAPLSERLALGAALLALALAGVESFRALRASDDGRARVRALGQETKALREKARALEKATARGATQSRRAVLTAQAAPPRVVADLAELLPPDARIARLDLAYGDELKLDLRVEARSPAAYDRLLGAFLASGRLEDIATGPEAREGEVTASVRATYRPRGEP